MTRKEFAIEMTKYAMRDPNNHRDDYGISLVQNGEGMSKIKLVDKRSKSEKKADAARSRNGSWSAFRPAVMRDKTKYARKGRRAEENWR